MRDVALPKHNGTAVCAVSGTAPEEPVVSTKTGHVYEKRLVEKHIKVFVYAS